MMQDDNLAAGLIATHLEW